MGFSRVHAARGLGGVAAHIGHFFQEHKVLAGLLNHNGSSHACAACTDNHNVGIQGFVFPDRVFLGIPAEFIQHGNIRAGSFQCLGCSRNDRGAGDGGTGHAVHIGRLSLDNGFAHGFHSHAAQGRRFQVALDGYIGDFIFGHGHTDLHHAAEALSFRFIGAGSEQCRRRQCLTHCAGAAQRNGQYEEQGKQFFHGVPPFCCSARGKIRRLDPEAFSIPGKSRQ